MKKNSKRDIITLKSYLKRHVILLLVMCLLFLLLIGLVVVSSILLKDDMILYVLYGCCGVFLIALVVMFIVFNVRFFRIMYNDALMVSKRNFEALANFDKELEYCSRNDFAEFRELNSSFKDLSKNLDGRTIISKALSYDSIELEYLDEEKYQVKESSLKNKIGELILARESFRNALIDISYDLRDETINEKDHEVILKYIKNNLPYDHTLVALKDNAQGYLIYIPALDSVSQIKEELSSLMKNISLIKKVNANRTIVSPSVSMVMYPYSDIDNLFNDLSYAKRSKLPLNFYIPKRKDEKNKKMLVSSLNMNNVFRLQEQISSIDTSPDNYDKNLKLIYEMVKEISNYYNFSCGGCIFFDHEKNGFYSKFSHSPTNSSIFKDNVRINKEFVNVVVEVADIDNSYYFSSRKHVNDDFAHFMDKYHIKSGLFYVVKTNNNVIGLLYFVKKSSDLMFDSFMKENLITSCSLISNFFKETNSIKLASVMSNRFNDMVKFSNSLIYSIDKETYEIAMLSDSLRRLLPKVQAGDKCYKALYDLDAPCKNCPLLKNKHMISSLCGGNYESMRILQIKNDSSAHILLKSNDNKFTYERYDQETLLATFFSFKETMEKYLSVGLLGNVLFVSVKNIQDIINDIGNAGFANALKQFCNGVVGIYQKMIDVYYYSKDTIALIMPNSSREDLVNLAEAISDGEIEVKVNDKDIRLNLVYLAKAYTNEQTFEQLVETFEENLIQVRSMPVDEIYFVDANYKRNASKEGYLFETLQDAFENKTFQVYFQPIVRNSDRLIEGSELLLKVFDQEANAYIDIAHALQVAEKRGYTSNIALGLLDYVEGIIKKYGFTFFLTSGLNHLSLNINHTFLKDGNFINKCSKIVSENSLPKGFLSFEIDEEDAANNLDVFTSVKKEIEDAGCLLLCDNFRGEFTSPKVLAEAGFSGVKIDSNLVEIIRDGETNKRIMNIWSDVVKAHINIFFTGVATRIISEEIVFEDHDSYVQGNYFFAPQSEEEMFESIRQRNMKDKEMDN